MRDKKDNATLDLPGFDASVQPAVVAPAAVPARRAARSRIISPPQLQFELLDATDASGLPVWRREEGTDLSGLPVWAAAC